MPRKTLLENISWRKIGFCFLLMASLPPLFAQQPTDTLAGERTKFIGKISHWLAAYGASGEDFMREKRNAFKSAAFAEVYIEGIIDHPAWMFTMLNRVTQAKYAEKQTPYILFGIKFKPQDDNLNSYEISLTLQDGSAIAPQRDDGIVSSASAKHLGGKTYAEPVAAEADLENAIGEALDGLQAKLGNTLAPKLMVRYQDEVFWNGHEIPILDAEGNSVELEAIDRDGALLSPDEISWTNADPFQSRGVVDMTDTQTKAVTLSWGNDVVTVTLNRVSVSQDINELLKALIIEALTTKKQETLDSVTILKQDSIANAQAVAQAIRQLEAQNFQLEGGNAPIALFADGPRVMTAQDEGLFDDSPSRAESFRLLRARRELRMRIRKKVNVVAFANLLVDRPDQVQVLLDALLRDSGRLIAQLVLNRNQDGLRDAARNIVVDFLNRNIEQVAGGRFGFAQEVEPPLELPVATTPASAQTFNTSKFLYINDLVAFDGKEAFITEMEAYLSTLPEPLYVFVNYSQDVSTESYLQRASSTRPRGLPEGAKYVTLTLINIPGSVKYQVVASQGGVLTASGSVKNILAEYLISLQSAIYYDRSIADIWIRNLNEIACAKAGDRAGVTIEIAFIERYSIRYDPSFSYAGTSVTVLASELPSRGNIDIAIGSQQVTELDGFAIVSYSLTDGKKVALKVPIENRDELIAVLANPPATLFDELVAEIPLEESQEAYSKLSRLPICSYSNISLASRMEYFRWLSGEAWTNTDQEEIILDLIKHAANRNELYKALRNDPVLLADLMLSCDGDNRDVFVNEISRLCDESWSGSIKPKGTLMVGVIPSVYGTIYAGNDFITAVSLVETGVDVHVVNFMGRFNSLPFNWGNVQELRRVHSFDGNLLDPVEVLTTDGSSSIVPLLYPVNLSQVHGNGKVIEQFTNTLNYIGVLASLRILVKGATLVPKTIAITELTKTGLDYLFDNPRVIEALSKTENGKTFLRGWQIASIAIDLTTIGADVLQDLAKHGPEAGKLLREAGETEAANHVDRLAAEASQIVTTGRVTRSLDEILINGAIPSVRNKEFHSWYDELTPEEFELVWADESLREIVKSRIRQPGGQHEWCMVCETPKFKRWNIPMDEIKRFRNEITELRWTVPEDVPNIGGFSGGHSLTGSTTFHNELQEVITASNSLEEFNSGLADLIKRWNIDPNLLPSLITNK